jgi:hypothetical protein
MPNAWMEHVRQFRKQNRHLSYKQLLSEAKNTYGGGPVGNDSPSSLTRSSSRVGGGVTGYESPSSLTRSASKVGGRRSRHGSRSRSRRGGTKMNDMLKQGMNTLRQAGNTMGKLGGRKSRRRRR